MLHVDRARLGVEVREGALEGAAEVADLLRVRADEGVRLGVAHRVGEPGARLLVEPCAICIEKGIWELTKES